MIIKLKRYSVEYNILIDEEDFNIVSSLKLNLLKQGKKNGKLRVYCRKTKNYLHRIIMNCPKGMTVDHIDGNPLNNVKSNLRVCTMKQNQFNTRKKGKNNTSKYKGVCLDSWAVNNNLKKKWVARIKINYKSINLGRFFTEEEAALAYNKRALKEWGEFANLNEIN